MNSRAKGCRGERAWRDYLKEHGFEARRGQQYSGSPDSPDVVSAQLDPFLHPEVKCVEKLNIHEAIEQVKRDCPKGKWRYIAHKRNRGDWMITMPADDWMDLVKEWMDRSR